MILTTLMCNSNNTNNIVSVPLGLPLGRRYMLSEGSYAMHVHIHVNMYVCVYIYIYIRIERERDREITYIYTCIHM